MANNLDLMQIGNQAVAAAGLMETIILPAFGETICKGFFEEAACFRGMEADAASLAWLEDHFDTLSTACYAVQVLLSQIVDTVQMLPDLTEPVDDHER